MKQFLFRVVDRFDIEGRGLVVIPGIPEGGIESFKVGARIGLVLPDGKKIFTSVQGIEVLFPRVPGREMPVLLDNLKKSDVPVGTEVWWVRG